MSEKHKIENIYFQSLKKSKILSKEEEQIAIKEAQNGSIAAQNKIIIANLRFVVSIAKTYARSSGYDVNELISEGNLGLIRALHKFNSDTGFRFITYAVWWVKQHINEYIITNNNLKYSSINCENNSENCDKSEILSIYNISEELNIIKLENEEANKQQLNTMFNALTKREIEIINMYFGLNDTKTYTLEEIAEKYSLTKMRVKNIKDKAIRKMRGVYIINKKTS